MRWADFVLRLLLRRRDRDAISGDLLEEYREEILPKRGPIAARIWYVTQVASFVRPEVWGVAIGAVAGIINLVDTAIEPLADDDGIVTPVLFGLLLLLWALTGFGAAHRTRRFRDAIVAGLLVGIATITVFHLAAILRVNVFLDEIRARDDWRQLIARFQASGFHSLRAYANYEYVRLIPLVVALGGLAGAVSGAMGGAVDTALRIAQSAK
jgi:hypothetical protein